MSQSGTTAKGGITPGTVVQTLTGNTGGPVGPDLSGNINVIGDGTSITVTGNPGTNTETISLIAPVSIANGGTNASSFANTNGVVYFDGTRLVDTTVGTAGQVLTSQGTGLPPHFASAGSSGITTIDGDTGSVTGTTVTIAAGNASLNSGSTVSIDAISATELQLSVSDGAENTIIGNASGNLTLTGNFNTGLGQNVLGALTTGSDNVAIGADALNTETSGSRNIAIGLDSLNQANGTTDNTAVGDSTLGSLTTGTFNLALGSSAGGQYSSTESSNILLNSPGVTGDSNTLRIGAGSGGGSGDLSAAYIYGVNGVTVSSPLMVVLDSSTEQWGTQAVPGGGISTLTGDDGTTVTGTNVNILAYDATNHCGATVEFTHVSTNTLLLNVTDSENNTLVGKLAGGGYVTGSGAHNNIGLGNSALDQISQAFGNVAIGNSAAQTLSGSGTDARGNIVLGHDSAQNLASGSYNVIQGYSTASAYSGSESSNIVLGAQIAGVTSESHVLRIGNGTGTSAGQLTSAFIAGINGVTTSNSLMVTIDSTSDQLGVAAIPGGGGITTIDGNTGTATGSTVTITTGASNAEGTALFTGDNSSTITMTFSDTSGNTGLGTLVLSSLIGGGNNTALGVEALQNSQAGSNTVAIGAFALNASTIDADNTAVGVNAGVSFDGGGENIFIGSGCAVSLLTGASNTIVGASGAFNLTSGNFNTILGENSASAYTGSESSNIIIGNAGVVGESNVIRIGTSGSSDQQQDECFIGGINGVTTSNSLMVTMDSVTEQLGTAAIPSATSLSYTNVSTSPYVVLVTDQYISVDSSGGARTIQFPNAATLGKSWIVKDRTGSAATNNITITTVGGAVNIDGATTFIMNTAYESIEIIGNGSTYEIY